MAQASIRRVDKTASLEPVVAGGMLEIDEPSAEMVAAVAGEDLETRREQMQLQVAQLADHLRQRLAELDRREATVNARVAQLESDLRASRLWLRERELTFQERERELEEQILELREKVKAEPAAPDVPTPLDNFDPISCLAEIAQREQQLQMREDELRERRFELDRASAALSHAQDVWHQRREQEEQQHLATAQRLKREIAEQSDEVARDSEALLAQRQQQLRNAELVVAAQAEELERERSELMDERHQWEEQRGCQQRALEELRASVEGELADRRAKLDARQEWLERQRSGLEQARDEALRLHRQSLEMRLVAEQVWSQIRGTLNQSEVAEAIGQLKQRLAEQYRGEEQLLATRHEALVEISEKVAAQHRDLMQLKDGMRQWSAARELDLRRQETALTQRETELLAQQEKMRQSEQEWNADRRRYERQIRELSSQMPTLATIAH